MKVQLTTLLTCSLSLTVIACQVPINTVPKSTPLSPSEKQPSTAKAIQDHPYQPRTDEFSYGYLGNANFKTQGYLDYVMATPTLTLLNSITNPIDLSRTTDFNPDQLVVVGWHSSNPNAFDIQQDPTKANALNVTPLSEKAQSNLTLIAGNERQSIHLETIGKYETTTTFTPDGVFKIAQISPQLALKMPTDLMLKNDGQDSRKIEVTGIASDQLVLIGWHNTNPDGISVEHEPNTNFLKVSAKDFSQKATITVIVGGVRQQVTFTSEEKAQPINLTLTKPKNAATVDSGQILEFEFQVQDPRFKGKKFNYTLTQNGRLAEIVDSTSTTKAGFGTGKHEITNVKNPLTGEVEYQVTATLIEDDSIKITSNTIVLKTESSAGSSRSSTSTPSPTPLPAPTPTPAPSCGTVPGTVLVVDGSVAASGNGTTWMGAYKTINEALTAGNIAGKTEIWVKAGTYTENSLTLVNDVDLLGGFDCQENAASQATPKTNVTTINGGGANRILSATNLANATAISGFTFTNGNAAGGGAININNSIVNVSDSIFTSNNSTANGGAIFITGDTAGRNVAIDRSVFASNTATGSNGGAIYDQTGAPTVAIRNSIFRSNTATGQNGGAIAVSYRVPGVSNPGFSLLNSVLLSNSAANGGGIAGLGTAIQNGGVHMPGTPLTSSALNTSLTAPLTTSTTTITGTITNTIFWLNTATTTGNQIYVKGQGSTITYTTDLFNTTTANPNISVAAAGAGGNATATNGGGNVASAADPFSNVGDPDGADNVNGTVDDGLNLSAGSAAKGVGTNGVVTGDIITSGTVRPQGVGTYDIGAFEVN